MCVATVIVAGAAIAGSVIAAKAQGAAADRAAQTARDTAAEALRVQKEQYAQARADFEPYAAVGRSAIGRMRDRAAQAPVTFDPTNAATWQGSNWQAPAATDPGGGSAPPPPGQAPPSSDPGRTPAQLGLPQANPSAMGFEAAPATTLMQAPDGSPPRPVPSRLVQDLIAKGARVVQPLQGGGR
jgi:hypothetical protein